MGLKGFLESAKFRHLFFPGLFPLPHSMTVKIISLSCERKGGEKGGWLRTVQVTVHKNNFGPAKTVRTNAFGLFFPPFKYVVNLSSTPGFCAFVTIIWV